MVRRMRKSRDRLREREFLLRRLRPRQQRMRRRVIRVTAIPELRKERKL